MLIALITHYIFLKENNTVGKDDFIRAANVFNAVVHHQDSISIFLFEEIAGIDITEVFQHHGRFVFGGYYPSGNHP